MTDNEIIKALECCNSTAKGSCLNKCPYFNYTAKCSQAMIKDTLDLINRQQSQIEALRMDNAQLHSDIINANQNLDHITNLWENEKEKVAKAKQKVIDAYKMLKTAKSEAVKEFAEQIPKKHHHTRVVDVKCKARESVCPDCLGIIITAENEYPKFCTWCGQTIDWSGGEKRKCVID